MTARKVEIDFKACEGIRHEAISFFETYEVLEQAHEHESWNSSFWRVGGTMPATHAEWVTVLFSEPTKKQFFGGEVVACRLVENDGDHAVISARGPVGDLVPVAMVEDFSAVSVLTQGDYVGFRASRETISLVFTQYGSSTHSPIRTLILIEGYLYSSVDSDETLPQYAALPIRNFIGPQTLLPSTVPMLTVGDAILRMTGRDPVGAPWRIDPASFERAWAEVHPPWSKFSE